MKYTITAILFCLLFVQCKAQSVNPGLKDAEDALKNGSPVSLVLTNPSFMDLHPQDEFRQLIKKYADSLPVDISPAGEPGRRIRAIVNVKNANGEPVKNCLVYFYQTDAKGWYSANSPHVGGNSGDMGHARLFGYGRTNSQGQLIVETVKPSFPYSRIPIFAIWYVSWPRFTTIEPSCLRWILAPVYPFSVQLLELNQKLTRPPSSPPSMTRV